MSGNGTFTARVRICLDKGAMHGRAGWGSGIRPNHRIPGRNTEMFMGNLSFTDREWLRPGECTDAVGTFMVVPADMHLFASGFTWDLCEGSHVIGHAVLLERING